MQFGANVFIWADHFGPEQYPLIAKLKRHGFDGLEIPLIEPGELDARAVRQNLNDHGMQCTFCSVLPPGLSTIAEESLVRNRTKDHWIRCIHLAAEIGGKIIAGPLCAPVGYLPGRRRSADEWKRAVELLAQLGPELDATGVTLAIEPLNRFETYFLNTAADAVALCQQIGHPRVGILFDTFHANIEEKDVPNALRQTAPWLTHVHSCENDRGIPGSGHTDWKGVCRALSDMQYDGWLVIESFGFSLGALSSAASIWRDLAPSAEDIALDGLRFLTSLTSES